MPPRRRSADSPTPSDLTAMSDALALGKRVTVYLREGTPSLGLDAGASARVVSVAGSTVIVRPRGVDDELPYEADEILLKKPTPRGKPAPVNTPKSSPTAPKDPSPRGTRVANLEQSGSRPGAPEPATPAPTTPAATKPSPAKGARAKSSSKKAPKSVTVTIFGSADNEWWVSVARGGRKPAQSRPVTPDAVEGALGELDDYAALTAAKSVLDAAREAAERRVAELSRELAAAQEALDALNPK